MTAQQLRQDLQIDERWPPQLCTPGILATITNKVYSQFALTTLKREVCFATWWSQRDRCTCADRSPWQLVDCFTAKTNAFVDLLNAYLVPRKAVTFLAYLHIDRYLTIRHVRPVHAQVKVHAAAPEHRPG